MKIDHCLILSAGSGTRMGAIGKVLPKILWPVFEKTLLQLQIEYAKSLGCKEIYINAHFLYEKILTAFKNLSKSKKESITLIYEPVLLGSGGAVHNIAHLIDVDKRGLLLVLNGDQFLFSPRGLIEMALDMADRYPAVLFSIEVAKEATEKANYNEIKVQKDRLVGIERPSRERFCTYSGMGIINLKNLDLIKGYSNFFDTVADFKNKEVLFIQNTGEYWDFGTLDRYYHSLFQILKKHHQSKSGPFIEFCLTTGTLLEEKIDGVLHSYNHNSSNTINLSRSKLRIENPQNNRAIILESEKDLKIESAGIHYKNIFENFSDGQFQNRE